MERRARSGANADAEDDEDEEELEEETEEVQEDELQGSNVLRSHVSHTTLKCSRFLRLNINFC